MSKKSTFAIAIGVGIAAGMYVAIDSKLLPLAPLRGIVPNEILTALGDEIPAEVVSESSSLNDETSSTIDLSAKSASGASDESSESDESSSNSQNDTDSEDDSEVATASETNEDSEEEEFAEDIKSKGNNLNLISQFQEGQFSNRPTLDALNDIAQWKLQKIDVPERDFEQYAMHKKTWVRLAALAYAIELNEYSEKYLKLIANDIVAKHSNSQIWRFLERYRNSQPDIYEKMSHLLS